MKNEKNYMGFLISKVWQILKHFGGAFRWAQTSYFWRVWCGIEPKVRSLPNVEILSITVGRSEDIGIEYVPDFCENVSPSFSHSKLQKVYIWILYMMCKNMLLLQISVCYLAFLSHIVLKILLPIWVPPM